MLLLGRCPSGVDRSLERLANLRCCYNRRETSTSLGELKKHNFL